MAVDWRRSLVGAWRLFRPNGCCWAGATIGLVSMLFTWMHVERLVPLSPINLPASVLMPPFDPNVSFMEMLGAGSPGPVLFLTGTVLAYLTYFGGVLQATGLAVTFLAAGSGLHVPYATYFPYSYTYFYFEFGFYLALFATFVVITGIGISVRNSRAVANYRRLAYSPRLLLVK